MLLYRKAVVTNRYFQLLRIYFDKVDAAFLCPSKMLRFKFYISASAFEPVRLLVFSLCYVSSVIKNVSVGGFRSSEIHDCE